MLSTLRKYKLTFQAYNFFKKKELKHNLPLYKKYGLNKKYHSSISNQDFKGIDSPKNKYDLKDSAHELANDPYFDKLDLETQGRLLEWSGKGYAILEKFFNNDEIESFNNEIDQLLDKREIQYKYGNKIMFAIHKSPLLHNAGNGRKLIEILSMLLGKKVELFQSINFTTGSEQRTHSDSIHMTTFPSGNLIAVWVALEDLSLECGPLHYYPGSHKLPYIMNEDYGNVGSKYKLGNKTYTDYEDRIEEEISSNKLKKEIFVAKKGDVLIWHANLLHGGEKLINKDSTRKSMVFHYYSTDAICFHEITQRPTLKK